MKNGLKSTVAPDAVKWVVEVANCVSRKLSRE